MTDFRFRLQRVLDWRRNQLELEEIQYRRQLAALAELDRRRAELEESGRNAERQVREWNPLAAGELEALGDFRLYVKHKQQEMVSPRIEACKQLERQHGVMLEARRRLRLLELLKERQLAQWRGARDKDLEETAAESYLAKWQRQMQKNRTYNEENDA